jgi:hypothetical protein
MMIKVETYKQDLGQKEEKGWYLIDEVVRINKISKRVPFSYHANPLSSGAEIQIFDLAISLNRNLKDMPTSEYNIVELDCIDRKGNNFFVEFDTVAYILNENGKTVEVVSANAGNHV